MKKYLNFALVLVAGLSVVLSCSKIEKEIDNPAVKPGNEAVVSVPVTITATLPDADTKVAFEATFDANFKPTAMKRTWEADDKLRVINPSNTAQYAELDLQSGDGSNTAVFHGTLNFTASAFNVEVVEAQAHTTSYGVQTQAANGDTNHLQFVASATGVTDLTAAINLTETSGVLGIIAKLPASATDIESVDIVKISDNSTVLKINLTDPAVGSDPVLKLFANMQAGVTIDAGEYFIRFNAPSTAAHTVYTRYYNLASAVAFGTQTSGVGEYRTLKLNCVNTDKYAGGSDNGSATAPYLIADKYQLAAVHGLAPANATTYFKMMDNVDMQGLDHKSLNTDIDGFSQAVDFNGNNKTISNLGKHLFYVLKGSVYDLTLDRSNVTSRGILADYIQGSGHTVTNITVTNGAVTYGGSDAGGLIGYINKGTDAAVVTATITNCTVSNTDVSGVGVIGGVLGFTDAKVEVSGCTFTGGTVTATARYCGGLIGSTGDYASTITDCHVTDATITSSSDRVGGCVGQIGKNGVTFKGCTVGTSSQRVTIASTASGSTVNAGGFAGVCYGTVTGNGSERNKTYVTITSSNSTTSTYVNIGGFIGYLEAGTIDKSDADAVMSSIKGHRVAGFAAYVTSKAPGCTVDNCTSQVQISGAQNYIAGFIGDSAAANHVITNNTAAGSVSGAAAVAGFVGQATQGTWTGNSTSCTVTGSGANNGGFAGWLDGNVTVSRCSCSGEVTGNGNVCGGFVGLARNGATINDCYSTSTLSGTTRKRGGIIGYVDAGTATVNRCYSTSNISANFELGGLVGYVIAAATLNMSNSAAWNGSIVASSRTDANWSSAAVVGVLVSTTSTLTNNYRNPAMTLTTYWGNATDSGVQLTTAFQHPDVDSTHPLTDWNGAAVTSSTMRPYQGKCDASKTLSELASTTLGWDSSVWDFTGDLPTLK